MKRKTVAELQAIAETKAKALAELTELLRKVKENLRLRQKEWEQANLAYEKAHAEYIIARDTELE